MIFAGLDGTTFDGSNSDLNDPIGYGIRKVGSTVSDPSNVADSDLAAVADNLFDALLDVSELRLLRNIRGNLDLVDTTAGPLSESLSQVASQVGRDIIELQAFIKDEYGLGGLTMEADVIRQDFAEHDDTVSDI